MAELKNGILKGISGKIGGLIVYEVNGKTLVRSKPGSYRDKKSPAQLAQRQKMVLVNDLLNTFSYELPRLFEPKNRNKISFHAAKSYNLRNAIKGEYPDQRIDFRKALVAKGDVGVPINVKANFVDGNLNVTWDMEPGQNSSDTVVVLSRHVSRNAGEVLFTTIDRSAGECKLEFDYVTPGEYVFWMAFRASNESDMSNSCFLEIDGWE